MKLMDIAAVAVVFSLLSVGSTHAMDQDDSLAAGSFFKRTSYFSDIFNNKRIATLEAENARLKAQIRQHEERLDELVISQPQPLLNPELRVPFVAGFGIGFVGTLAAYFLIKKHNEK